MKLILILCLIINSAEASFSMDYKVLLIEVKNEIKTNCKRELPVIEFSWMPRELESMLPNEIARFNQGKVPWIEFSSKFKDLPFNLKRLNIFHEIGHIFGLEHKDGIMHEDIFKSKENFKEYYEELCPRIAKLK